MNQLSTYSWTFDEDVIRYSKAGYRAIGVWRSKLSDFGDERGIELLREEGVAVSNLMWAGGFTGCDGRSFEDSVTDALEAIALAARLRAECLVVYSGSRAGHTHNHARRLCYRAFERMLPDAERLGVTLAIAPVHRESDGEWSFLHEFADGLAFINSLGTSRAKVVFDNYQLAGADVDFKMISSGAQQIAVVHLADAQRPPGGEVNCCLLGDGSLNISQLITSLHDGGYAGYFDVKLMGEDVESYEYEHVLKHSASAFDQLSRGLPTH